MDRPCLPKAGEVFLGFSTQRGLVSWLIRRSTASPASHSFLVYYSEHFQQHMVLEVQGRGFVQVPWDVWQQKNRLLALYQIERTVEELDTAMASLGRRLGDPYDAFSILGFLLIYFVPIWDRNDLDDKGKLVCSEMVALFLRWSKIPLNTHIDRVVPQDLWRLAVEHTAFTPRYESGRAGRKLNRACRRGRELRDPNQP
jgi:hypothetical protein